MVLCEEFTHSVVTLLRNKSCQNRHCLHPIIRLVGIFGSAVLLQRLVPIAFIERIDHLVITLLRIYRIGIVPRNSRQLGKTFQRKGIPTLLQRLLIDIGAPITPKPSTFAKFNQFIIRPIPYIKNITLHSIVDIVQYGCVTRLQIVGVEPIISHGSQHLTRELSTKPTRDWRVDCTILALMHHQLVHCLACEQMRPLIKDISCLSKLNNNIAPPLTSFTIRAIHIGVTHIYIERALCLLPKLVAKFIVGVKRAHKIGVVAALAILHIKHFNSLWHNINHIVTIGPYRSLKLLLTIACDIVSVE